MWSQQKCHSSKPQLCQANPKAASLRLSSLETSAQMFTARLRSTFDAQDGFNLITTLSKGSIKVTQPPQGARKALLTQDPGSALPIAVPAPQGCVHPTATVQWLSRTNIHQEMDQDPAMEFRSSQVGCASPQCRSSLKECQQGSSGVLPGTEGSEAP